MLYVVFSGQEKDHIGKNQVTERNIIKNTKRAPLPLPIPEDSQYNRGKQVSF